MDWRDAAQEKLKEVGHAIAQDIEDLLESAASSDPMAAIGDAAGLIDAGEAQAI